MKAATKAANKSKFKKRSKGKGVTSADGGSGGRGFGTRSSPAPAAPNSSKQDTKPRESAAGEPPDDDYGTFPRLSYETLDSIMGVDVFDLPPGGVPASELGQQIALPFQVLQTIRGRYGFPEFAGGRRLLDAAYRTVEEVRWLMPLEKECLTSFCSLPSLRCSDRQRQQRKR